MQTLLSVPENIVSSFNDLEAAKNRNYFVASDPSGQKVGSGGGTAWLLAAHYDSLNISGFHDYLKSDKKIIIHAGGQSRRLPAYAPLGKVLTPVPVFSWSRGQRLDQNLLDLQLPLFERLMEVSSSQNNTLVASGDVLVQYNKLPAEIPRADVICLGICVDPHLASRHGVFFTPKNNPAQLDFMLQKPTHKEIEQLTASHLFMMDVGIWILSDRAVELLMKKCGWDGDAFSNGTPSFFDLYSSFGTCLGRTPSERNEDLKDLSVAIVPLEQGEFYHYGTSEELISSTEKIQNIVKDRRAIWHNRVKPHSSLFVQNAHTGVSWSAAHHHIWIENSFIPHSWQLNYRHVITGIPRNNWNLELLPGVCIDVVPVGEEWFCLRPYHIDDKFSGVVKDDDTKWLNRIFNKWLQERGLTITQANIDENCDIQEAKIFPLLKKEDLSEELIKWMIAETVSEAEGKKVWLSSDRLSASEISNRANIDRIFQQRNHFRRENLKALCQNYQHSVFYQSDLSEVAADFARENLPLPEELADTELPMVRSRNYMLRSEIQRIKGYGAANDEANAFSVLQNSIINSISHHEIPKLNVYPDQIVWGRSPARLDLAGGWSDTPPYCIQAGGRVLNMAVNLNGQPPLQVFVRMSEKSHIVLRSIDNGVSEIISSYQDLDLNNSVGSAFSIPKAALCLAGFHPEYSAVKYATLEQQLIDFGGGFEISLLAAIPKGSGLGTSSILAATILGALADFCSLSWDKQAVAHRTLILEQMLTTGGGWQDQYGGILPGIKLLETAPGMQEQMGIRWLPDLLLTQSPYQQNWLLYYTGITRVAKNILGEIVRGMFLNQGARLRILDAIKDHAFETYEAIQQCDYEKTARMIKRSWELNKALDPGTTTDQVSAIVRQVDDLTIGHKLLGAGGGGYLLMCAKDETAAARIKEKLSGNPLNGKARFVNMELNNQGLEVSRS